MRRYTVYSLIICLALCSGLRAQALSGRVLDSLTGDPVPGAEVYDVQSHELRTADAQGFFYFESLDAGPHRLRVFSYQYQEEQILLDLQADTSIAVYLSAWGETLSEVLINEQRDQRRRLSRLRDVEGTAVYAGRKSEVIQLDQQVANLAANNARQIYAQVAGLNIYENNDAGLQLNIGGRGLDPNRTSNFNVRQNGYDISADVLGYPESYYTPTAEALSEIQVVRGAASLQYGTQFGGLLNFKFKEPAQEKGVAFTSRQTVGSFGLYTSFNRLSGRVGKWSYQAFFNYREGDGFRPNARFHARNYFLQTTYHISDHSSIRAEYTHMNYLAQQAGGLTDQQFYENPLFSNRERNWFRVQWRLYALKYRQRLSKTANFSLNVFGLGASRDALGFRGNPALLNQNPITAPDEKGASGDYRNPRDYIRNTFENWGAEARYLQRWQSWEAKQVFLLGAKYYQSYNTARQGPGNRDAGPDFQFYQERFPDYANQSDFVFPNLNAAFFTENVIYLGQRWSITPGLRFEHIETASRGSYQEVIFDNAGNPIFRDTLQDRQFLPRNFLLAGLGLSYRADEVWEWYGNISQNYRSVTFSDIRITNPAFKIDPDISDEEGFTTDLGLRGQPLPWLNMDLSTFALYYDNRIGLIFNERAQRVRKNIGTALIYGLESFVEVDLHDAFSDVQQSPWACSFFSNLAITRASYIASEESNVIGKEVEFIPRYNWKSGLQAGWKNLLASFQYTYVSEQFTDVENSPKAPEGALNEGLIGPIPAYAIADLSLAYRFKWFKLEAGINNLFDAQYFTRRATGYPGPGIIPSSPRSYYFTLGFDI